MTYKPSPCACLGPLDGEPYCNCKMVIWGIPRSEEYRKKHAEATKLLRQLFVKHKEKK